MMMNIRTFASRRAMILVLGCAMALCGGYLIGRAAVPQPHMHAALQHLQAAKSDLQTAETDKGGHRAKAIQLVNDAIGEVEAGIEYANTH